MDVKKLTTKKYKSACHVLALGGLADEKTGKEIDGHYTDLSNIFAMPDIFDASAYNKDFIRSLLDSKVQGLANRRKHFIEHLAMYFGLRMTSQSTSDPIFYLCGGFADKNVTPEHMWIYIEDSGYAIDTFPSIDFVRIAKTTINHPPSEQSAFHMKDTASIPIYDFDEKSDLQELMKLYKAF